MGKQKILNLSFLYNKLINHERIVSQDINYICFQTGYLFYGDDIEFLRRFETLLTRDIYSKEGLKNLKNKKFYNDNYWELQLLLKNDEQVCVIRDFHIIILNYLILKLKSEIQEFLNFIESDNIQARYAGYALFEGDILKIKGYKDGHPHKTCKLIFKKIKNFTSISYLFFSVTKDFLIFDDVIEINLPKIKSRLNDVNYYDFSKLLKVRRRFQ